MPSSRGPQSRAEYLRLAKAREAEANHRATIGEARLVMNVRRVLRFYRSTGYLEDAFIQVCHLDVWHPIGRRAVPAVADGFGEVALLFTLEGVMKDERAFSRSQVASVWANAESRGQRAKKGLVSWRGKLEIFCGEALPDLVLRGGVEMHAVTDVGLQISASTHGGVREGFSARRAGSHSLL